MLLGLKKTTSNLGQDSLCPGWDLNRAHFELKSEVLQLQRRWVDNIKMDLREIGCDGVDWIDMAQDRYQWRPLVNTALNLRVP
jgi:hypothetical protein